MLHIKIISKKMFEEDVRRRCSKKMFEEKKDYEKDYEKIFSASKSMHDILFLISD